MPVAPLDTVFVQKLYHIDSQPSVGTDNAMNKLTFKLKRT